MSKPAIDVHALISALIESADPRLLQYIYNDDTVYLAIPQTLIGVLKKEAESIGIKLDKNLLPEYQGIKIIPNHEMSLVLFHRDCHLMNYEWMVKKVMLAVQIKPKPYVNIVT